MNMSDLEIKIPKILETEKPQLEKRIEELIVFEAKRKRLLAFINEVLKGTTQLSDVELVKLRRTEKQGRYKKLKHQGLV